MSRRTSVSRKEEDNARVGGAGIAACLNREWRARTRRVERPGRTDGGTQEEETLEAEPATTERLASCRCGPVRKDGMGPKREQQACRVPPGAGLANTSQGVR